MNASLRNPALPVEGEFTTIDDWFDTKINTKDNNMWWYYWKAFLDTIPDLNKAEKYCSDFYIEARIVMQGILERTIFKDEKYSHVASYIKDMADNSIDLSITRCNQIIDEIYEIVENKMCCNSAGVI